jgi:hypothetical protein
VKRHEGIFDKFRLNDRNPMKCTFSLKEDKKEKTLSCRGYHLTKSDEQEIISLCEDLAARGFLREVPAGVHPQVLSPAMVVPKPDGTKRMVVDYSRLNGYVKPCALPLPLMEPLLDQLAQCDVKTRMDLQHGFWQVQLDPEAQALTSFISPDGKFFQYTVLPMGLSISPGVFQSFTRAHCREFKRRPAVQHLLELGSVVEVLMDDFLLGSKTKQDHLKLLEEWMSYAEEAVLFFKRTKCEFGRTVIDVLG